MSSAALCQPIRLIQACDYRHHSQLDWWLQFLFNSSPCYLFIDIDAEQHDETTHSLAPAIPALDTTDVNYALPASKALVGLKI